MTITFFILIVFGVILFAILSNNVEPKPQVESKSTLREGAFYDYANKYVTQIAPPWLIEDLKPYANKVVKRMLDLSKMYKSENIQFKLADEMELIECSLELCLKKISSEDFYNYLGNVKTARIVNTPVHIRCMAEKLIDEFFPLIIEQ